MTYDTTNDLDLLMLKGHDQDKLILYRVNHFLLNLADEEFLSLERPWSNPCSGEQAVS